MYSFTSAWIYFGHWWISVSFGIAILWSNTFYIHVGLWIRFYAVTRSYSNIFSVQLQKFQMTWEIANKIQRESDRFKLNNSRVKRNRKKSLKTLNQRSERAIAWRAVIQCVAIDALVSLATEICCCSIWWCCCRIRRRMFWAITSGKFSICLCTHEHTHTDAGEVR